MQFEDEYLDVLQNIEFSIVEVARRDTSVLDIDVLDALVAIRRRYEAELTGRTPSSSGSRLGAKAQAVFEAVMRMCDYRLNRTKDEEVESGPKPSPISVNEIIGCLKRIEKSARRWNKEGGRRGYIDFVSQYIR